MDEQVFGQPNSGMEPVKPGHPMEMGGAAAKVETLSGDVVNFSGQATTINANTVNLENGGAGAVKGETVTVRVKNGGVGAVMASKADIATEQGGVGAVMAQEVNVKGTNIGVAMAGSISGDARIAFDMRAGLLAGIAAGLVISAFKLIQQRRGR